MNKITDFDYTLRASGRTNGTTKSALIEDDFTVVLADGSIMQVRRTVEIAVTQPRGW